MDVLVEDIHVGDRIVLLSGRGVTVDGVVRDDEGIIARWSSGETLREPHKLAGQRAEVGSFALRHPGETISVASHERAPAVV